MLLPFYLLLGLIFGISDTGSICPSGYSSNIGQCYIFNSTKRSWENARDYCRSSYSGDLLSIHTSSLKDIVWSHTEGNVDGRLWVGAYSGYTWLDGTAIPSSWYLENEPNSDNEGCVEVLAIRFIRSTGLNDQSCTQKQEFACQADECYSIANCIEGSRCSWQNSYFSSNTCNRCYSGYYSGGLENGCIACTDGTFGINCKGECSRNCMQTCNKVTGLCVSCQSGWKGQNCDSACADGTFGMNCTGECSKNCMQTCNKVTGSCVSCRSGWKGQHCDSECDDGTNDFKCYSYCSGNCKNYVPCRKTDGHCPYGCTPGFTGNRCGDMKDTTTAIVAGVGAATILLVILGNTVMLWYLKRTVKGINVNKTETRKNVGMAMSDISLEEKASSSKPTGRAVNAYETLRVGQEDDHQYTNEAF